MVGRTLLEIESVLDLSWVHKKNKDYRIINTEQLWDSVKSEMSQAKLITVDTETTGLNINCLPWGNPHKDTCVGFSITWRRNQGIYIPLQHTEFENMSIEIVVEEIFPLLEKLPVGTHNGIFDYKVFYDMGCKLNLVHDSLILLFNIYSKVIKGSKALKSVTRLLYGDTTIEFSDIFEDKSDYTQFRHIDKEVCRIYTCADTDYPYQIILDNFNFLDKKQQTAYLRDVSFVPVVAVAEYNGKPIDMKKLPDKVEACRQNIRNLESLLFNYVGWKMTGDLEASYRFKTTSVPELVDILYEKLNYTPVEVYNKTGYKLDTFVLKKLAKDQRADDDGSDYFIQQKIPTGLNNMLEDISDKGQQSEKLQLIPYSKIHNKLCPPAFILLALRKQYKLLTSFFLKITKEAEGESGIYFSSISMTGTETARLVDFVQTLDSGLKYLISVPDPNEKYMFVFDFAQIEYRVMAALAKMDSLVSKLDDPHVDFHMEVASILLGIEPHKVDKDTRKRFKPINFGIPYGIGAQRLVTNIFGLGLSNKEKELRLKEVNEMLELWKSKMIEIMNMLNTYRSIARIPRKYAHPMTKELETTSYIRIPDGRLRVFDLKDMSESMLSKVDRMAGNTPIQGDARTIYMVAINDFYNALIREGLTDVKVENPKSLTGYSFHSKVTIHAFIHDEIVAMADSDVNPYYLYSLIYKYCMRKYEGHPTYYCGINICHNWYDGKYGEFEAPIDFVKAHLSNDKYVSPRSDWPQVVGQDIVQWTNKDTIRFIEHTCGEKLTETYILDVDYLLEHWKDYYYRTKINEYGFKYRPIDKSESRDDDLVTIVKVIGTLLYYKYDKLTVIWKDRDVNKLITDNSKCERDLFTKEKDFEELFITNIETEELDDDLLVDSEFEETSEFVNKKKNVAILSSLLKRSQ